MPEPSCAERPARKLALTPRSPPSCGYAPTRSASGAAGSRRAATWSRPPTSPPEAADPSPLPTEQGSRTAAGRHLPGAGLSRRDPRRRPHHGQHPRVPWPAPARPAHHQVDGKSLAQPARSTQERHPRRTYEQVHLRIHSPLRGAAVGSDNWVPSAVGRCGSQAAGVLIVIGQRWARRKVHSCADVPLVVTGFAWTVRGRT
jgi:hypothetical protein